MPATRTPFWLTKPERVALSEAIATLISSTAMFPAVREELDAVLTELGVVEARDTVWPAKADIVRRASGFPSDVLPIRMSDSELDAVLALPNLPNTVHTALTQRKT